MKSLLKYLSPFAPDQSGASSVFYELGGIIVIIDAGGCVGNICGFDEPRWFTKKSAIFSAGLRDMDAIMGRDDLLIKKISDTAMSVTANFVALVGTPVPAMIATDYRALKRLGEKKFNIPVLSCESNGVGLYDKGETEAYIELFKRFAKADYDGSGFIGIIGATPLELTKRISPDFLKDRVKSLGYDKVVCYGYGDGLDSFENAAGAVLNIAVSPAGLRAARFLKEKFNTPYVCGIPLYEGSLERLKGKILKALGEKADKADNGKNDRLKGPKALIVHQQVFANELRDIYLEKGLAGKADVATWFMMEDEIAEESDVRLREEDELLELVKKGGYDLVAGDPSFKKLLQDIDIEFVPIPHYAVSGMRHYNEEYRIL